MQTTVDNKIYDKNYTSIDKDDWSYHQSATPLPCYPSTGTVPLPCYPDTDMIDPIYIPGDGINLTTTFKCEICGKSESYCITEPYFHTICNRCKNKLRKLLDIVEEN